MNDALQAEKVRASLEAFRHVQTEVNGRRAKIALS